MHFNCMSIRLQPGFSVHTQTTPAMNSPGQSITECMLSQLLGSFWWAGSDAWRCSAAATAQQCLCCPFCLCFAHRAQLACSGQHKHPVVELFSPLSPLFWHFSRTILVPWVLLSILQALNSMVVSQKDKRKQSHSAEILRQPWRFRSSSHGWTPQVAQLCSPGLDVTEPFPYPVLKTHFLLS